MKRFLRLILSVIMIVQITGCSNPVNKNSDKLQIVTTVFPLYDFAKNIAGDKAEVTLLLPVGAEAHSYEPSAQDIIKIKECDLFINLGMGADPWTDAVISSPDLKNNGILSAMECVELYHEESGEHDEHEHSGYEYDQHVWTSVRNAVKITQSIKDYLCTIDEENSEYYKNNESMYVKELEKLDEKFTSLTENSASDTIVFADRFPFRYFAEDYNLKYMAAYPGCSAESEPSAAALAQLIDKVKEEKIAVVFYTETSNGQIPDTICEETGAKKMLLHSCHTVTKEQFSEGVSYITLMEKNYDALKTALLKKDAL